MPTPDVPRRFVDPKTGVLTVEAQLFCEFLVELLQGAPGTRFIRWVASGSPEGVVTGPVGCLAVRLDGAASTVLYIKESGTGSSGWRAV
mgnify:CR=1 FL=1